MRGPSLSGSRVFWGLAGLTAHAPATGPAATAPLSAVTHAVGVGGFSIDAGVAIGIGYDASTGQCR